ncbi:MAG: hypothetical protein HY814_08095 [Candidatus Riflebacteria bacterium]|nr:hypothetical protein [Candidatus Riflebacteria bacterium]
MRKTKLPPGWDENRVRRVLEHYEAQSDEDAANEDELAYSTITETVVRIPVRLLPQIRRLLTCKKAA